MKYIVLLRGINVGGKRKILMKELITHLEGIGFQHVVTYIQSGNIILDTSETDKTKVEFQISELIENQYGYDVPVMALDTDWFLNIFNHNPFIKEDIKSLHVVVLNNPQGDMELDPKEGIRVGNQIYLFCPDGYRNTKYGNNLIEKKLSCKATTRTWNTILKLHDLIPTTSQVQK